MRRLLLLLALPATSPAASGEPLPQEIEAFVAERDACDHFRDEPTEGTSPEQVERRAFVRESLEIYCAGTDRRLAALKRRYSGNAAVVSVLGRYEPVIEEARRDP